MLLTGEWNEESTTILKKISVACGNIESQLGQLPPGLTKKVAIQLYEDISAVVGALSNLTRQERASSQVACMMLRTLLEGAISVFAFCKNPEQRGKLYWDYSAVLDWKNVCRHEKNVGCPLVADEANVAERKKSIRDNLMNVGEDFIIPKAGKSNKERLIEALVPGKERNLFRNTWFPERRHEVLEQERMGWVYDVLYTYLCSAVHSDSAASKVFAGSDRGHMFIQGLGVWGAAIYKLVETFTIKLPSTHKGILRHFYESLQWSK